MATADKIFSIRISLVLCYGVLASRVNVDIVPLKEVQPLTGYIRGGVTALGAKKDFPVFLDETVILYDVISLSAGQRGTQIIIKPDDYIRATNATVAEISREKKS